MIKLFVFPFLIFSSIWGVSFLDRVPSLSPSASIVRTQQAHELTTNSVPIVAPRATTTTRSVVKKNRVVTPRVTVSTPAHISTTNTSTPPVSTKSVVSLITPPLPLPTSPTAPKPDSAQSLIATHIEERALVLMNNERAAQGLPRLTEDTRLSAIARGHSLDMRTHSYFSHTNQSGCSSSCRVSNAGYAWSAVGENIYTLEGYAIDIENIAQKVVDGWMNSAGHRANILGTQFTNQGVGVSLKNKTVYVTAVYSKPK